MKSLPFRKGEQLLYFCNNCDCWRAPNNDDEHDGWEEIEVVCGADPVFESTRYIGKRAYYTSTWTTKLRWCKYCDAVITNDYDGDENDNKYERPAQVWQCSNCKCIYPDRGEADGCCT